jgi:hypothetical protein
MLVQIAFRGRRRAEQHSRIRLIDVKGVTIRVGEYGDGRHAESPQGANDSACNDAAIRD